MKKRVFSLFLTLSLLAIPLRGTSTTALAVTEENTATEASTETSISSDLNKLHFYFDVEEYATIDSLSELNEATEYVTQKAETASLTRNVSANASGDELRLTVGFTSNIKETKQYKDLLAERETLDSMEEVRDFRHRLNSYSKAYHRALVAKNMTSLTSLEYESLDMIEYSPFVVMKTTAEDLDTASLVALASNVEVESICLSEKSSLVEEEIVDSEGNSVNVSHWVEVLESIGIYDTVSNQTFTGEGVSIGVLDLYISDIISDRITINPQYEDSVTHDHATLITQIISLLAPRANIFVSVEDGSFGLQWFIDQNCDIISCSVGVSNEQFTGSYRFDVDALIDYQADVHFITFVQAAGNHDPQKNPNNEIQSPGYAFNAITVGGTSRDNLEWVHCETSSFVNEDEYPVNKPNISAPAAFRIPEIGTARGTSFATPVVAGSIALLMEKAPIYRTRPDLVLSLVQSTAQKTVDYHNNSADEIEGFDNKVGAGMIHSGRMLEHCITNIRYNNTSSSSGVLFYSEDIYLSSGQELQVALAWFVGIVESTDGTVSNVYLTDYDIYLINTMGNVTMASSTLTDSNSELIRYEAELSGNYRIEVWQVSAKHYDNNADMLNLTYNHS